MTYSTGQEPVPEGEDLSAAPLDTPAPESPAPPAEDAPAAEGAAQPAPAPVIPDPAEQAAPDPAGVTVTDTGALVYPQPMPPAKPGFVNLATVPPMVSLTVPAEAAGGEAAVIDVYGTEVDEATAERAYAAAATAGFSLREL